MNYGIAGIQTTYRGRIYRSRLEARWAAMFDNMGWPYEYEPCDLDGWIPDFAIYGKHPIWVEVKPISTAGEPTDAEIKAIGKPFSRDDREILILGETIAMGCSFHGFAYSPILGWIRENGYSDASNIGGPLVEWWQRSPMGRWGPDGSIIGFCAEWGSYHDRMSGQYDGNCGGNGIDASEVLALWAEAGNQVRYIAKGFRR